MDEKDRKTYLDILRIAAALFVIAIHVIKAGADASAGVDRAVLVALHTAVRPAVSLFVMISGALWLDPARRIGPRRVARGVARLGCAFLFWSAFYTVVENLLLEHKSAKEIVSALIRGESHLWFLFMMICLYLIVPFLRKIAASRRLTGYFIVLSLAFTFVVPVALSVIDVGALNYVYKETYFHFTLGYAPYFMLGWYISSGELPKWSRIAIWALGAAALAASVFLTLHFTAADEQFTTSHVNAFHPFILMQATALFTFAKYVLSKIRFGDRSRRVLRTVASQTFGVYLIHPIVIDALCRLTGTDINFAPAALAVPVAVCAVFAVAYTLSALVGSVPGVGKYIV